VPTDKPQHMAPQANSHSLCFAVQYSDKTGLKNMTSTKTAEREAHIQSTEDGASVSTQAILFGASPLRRKHADCADQPRDLCLVVVVVHGSSHNCVWQAPGLQAVQPCFMTIEGCMTCHQAFSRQHSWVSMSSSLLLGFKGGTWQEPTSSSRVHQMKMLGSQTFQCTPWCASVASLFK